jgi:hypothetical protein
MNTRLHDPRPPTNITRIIAPTLNDINLATPRPIPIHVLHGQHPNRRPQPIPRRHLRRHLHAPVLDSGAADGVDTPRFHGRDDTAVEGVGGGDTAGPDVGGGGAGIAEVEGVVVVDEGGVLKGGFDPELAVLDEDVFFVVGRYFEFVVAARMRTRL